MSIRKLFFGIALSLNKEFFAGDLEQILRELPVNPLVREYIRQNQLYLKKPPICAMLYDLAYSLSPF